MPRRLAAATKKEQLFSLRLTHRTRLGLTLLARHRNTTIAGAVTLCIEDMFGNDAVGLLMQPKGMDTYAKVPDFIWSPYEHERFARLAEYFPELLSDEERYLWRTLQEEPKYWKEAPVQGEGGKKAERRRVRKIDLKALEADWPELKARSGVSL